MRKPEILILDDSASALDYATDARLRKAIREMEEAPTVFIVSQRTSSIQHADKIIVLDDGEIAAVGVHGQLLESCEVYRKSMIPSTGNSKTSLEVMYEKQKSQLQTMKKVLTYIRSYRIFWCCR